MRKKKVPTDWATNAQFAASNPLFRVACVKAGVQPTKRQASKWRRRTGLARQFIREANDELKSQKGAA